MSKLKLTLGIVAIAFITLTALSCKDAKKDNGNLSDHHSQMNSDDDHDHGAMESGEMGHDGNDGHHDGMKTNGHGDGNAEAILKDYFTLKDALVADDNIKAKELGGTLAKSLANLDISKFTDDQKAELEEIVEDAVEHAEHISESPIEHQREHFKTLSKDITDLVAIAGTANRLYEQFCPMYDGGSAWLSLTKDVKNPYYGSKMLTCGKVQKEIN